MSIKEEYDQWSSTYDSDRNLTRDLAASVLESTFSGQRFQSIVETGCGTGRNTPFLATIGKKIHAIDFSERMMEKAKIKTNAENVTFTRADLTKQWPCDDVSADLIVCSLVLEHIEDLHHIFCEASRVLQKEGKFFICELHPFRQYKGTKAAFEREGKLSEIDAFVHHISDFLSAAKMNGLMLNDLNEWWHAEDQDKPPRVISFIFMK